MELLEGEGLGSAVIFREHLILGLYPSSNKLLTLGKLYYFQWVPQREALFISMYNKIGWLLPTVVFLTYSKMQSDGAGCNIMFEMRLRCWCERLCLWLMELERCFLGTRVVGFTWFYP